MNHNRVLLYKLIPSGPFSHTFLRAHHSARTLEETGPVLTCWQTHVKSKDLLTLKTFVCMLRPFYYCWRGWESAPSAMLLHTFIDHNLFFQFTSPGIGFKNRLSHLMPAKAREAKDVRFKFKGWLQGKQAAPLHLSLQVSFALQRQFSIVVVDNVRNTNILHPCCGKAEWFLMFTEGDLPLYKAFF